MTNNNSQKGIGIFVGIIALVIVIIGYYYLTARQQKTLVGGSRISFQATNLDPLEKGHYEGWVISGEKKISFGNFNVNKEKQLVDLSGKVINEFKTEEKVENADAFAISIEPDNDNDPGPSRSLILFGKPEGDRANLSFGTGPGQINFDQLSGRYILGTPTDDPDKNETAGIWFADPTNFPKLAPTLNLPDAPTGWKYEGWAVPAGNKAQALSTGRFTKVSGADEFSGYNSTRKPGPPFPGEDFIKNLPFGLTGPLALDDGKSLVVVSIEPDFNGVDPTGEGPSQLKPLVGKIPQKAKDHFLYNLELKRESLPTGVASLLP